MNRCRHCGTTPLARAVARIAWWLHLSHQEDLNHQRCHRRPA
jgi:hypothetical protein